MASQFQDTQPDLSRSDQKAIIKEAINEWLDTQFLKFGRNVLSLLLVAAFAGVIYLALIGQGWKK